MAEEKIGLLLDELRDDYLTLHDVRCPFGNIDHVILSKYHGAFLIETKAHGGRVKVFESKIQVNGKPPEKDFIEQTLSNTYWLADELKSITGTKPWVTPLIVFTNAFVERSVPIKGIKIINKKFLLNSIQSGKPLPSEIWDTRSRICRLFKGED